MNPVPFLGLFFLLSLSPSASAQETGELGRMWTFESPPLAALEREYGFKPDSQWLKALRLGALRLGGEGAPQSSGSAAFVSSKGLIMTTTRCVREAVAATLDASGPTRDGDPLKLLKTGFVAATAANEIRLRARHGEWLTAVQLLQTSNVTDHVDRGVEASDSDKRRREKREANKQAILDAAKMANPNLVPQIVSLYRGRACWLYQYRVFGDVRLVCIPHLQAAQFGGDSDNFTYPRYSIDFAFLRAYEGGLPADTAKYHFKWKLGGAKPGELIFVVGNPGWTNRWSTLAELRLDRDFRIPIEIERLTNALRISKDPRSNTYSGEFDPENPSKYWANVRTGILRLENSLKAARGKLRGLEDARSMARKAAAERAFKGRVMADEALAKEYGDLWDRIASLVEERRQHEPRARFHTADGVLGAAINIVRLCDPSEGEELRQQARLELDALAGRTISLNFHGTAYLLDRLVRARGWLPEDGPFFTRVLGGLSPEDFLDVLERRTASWLGYPEQRDRLIESGWKAIQDSEDPVIVAARELAILMRENEARGASIEARESALGADLGRALLACYGLEGSPDGTGTLRFSDGVVKGYRFNGTIAPHRTTFYGLFARNTEFDNEHPFNLPIAWLDAKGRLDMATPINFVSTSDAAGSSSGSVVVNKELEVVGVVVDGNIEALQDSFVLHGGVGRSVSTHVDGIVEALEEIYGAHPLVRELTGK